MINWIEANLTNLKRHKLYDTADGWYDTEYFHQYVFLINGKHIIFDDELYLSYEYYRKESERPETGSFTIQDSSKLKVTHFARKSEYVKFLPKTKEEIEKSKKLHKEFIESAYARIKDVVKVSRTVTNTGGYIEISRCKK